MSDLTMQTMEVPLFDPKQLLEAFLGRRQQPAEHQTAIGGLSGVEDLRGGIDRQKAETFAAGAATGGLIGLLLDSKRAKKIGGEVLGSGGAAVLGGLADKEWQNHQIKQAAPAGVLAARVPASAASACPGPAPVLPAPAESAVDPSQGTAADRRHFALALMCSNKPASRPWPPNSSCRLIHLRGWKE
ncbi:MAG: DUF533 domain-containing protein [Dongiaceae bacterium]